MPEENACYYLQYGHYAMRTFKIPICPNVVFAGLNSPLNGLFAPESLTSLLMKVASKTYELNQYISILNIKQKQTRMTLLWFTSKSQWKSTTRLASYACPIKAVCSLVPLA